MVDAGQSFRGLDAVDRRTAWVSGGSTIAAGDGAVLRTTGEASRIYRTDDGGSTWTEAFRNAEPSAFYNCMDFFPGGRHGLAVSDPVDRRFRIAATSDGGRTWEVLPAAGMPASDGEYNFSATGDCLVTAGRHAWFGSGGSAARVFRSADRGLSWTAHDSTLRPGEAAGVFALAFRDLATVWPSVATSPRPRTARTPPPSPATAMPGARAETWPTWARTPPGTWERFSESGFHTLDCTPDGSCWAAGGGGRVGRL